MKFVKGISLFFVYPLIMFGLGVFVGVEAVQFFYPGMVENRAEEVMPEPDWSKEIVEKMDWANTEQTDTQVHDYLPGTAAKDMQMQEKVQASDIEDVAATEETLSVDTEYVLEETDIVNQTVVETVWRLPDKYVGLNREQFLDAMEQYELFPPLSELERGFIGLEVLSFARERVVIQMNYQYVQPSTSFYLAVNNHEVVVLLEDKETVYINTGILLETLPEDMQLDIIQMLWVEDEESLYTFLEHYSS